MKRTRNSAVHVIMGIDPGTTRIGIGIIEKKGSEFIAKKASLLIQEKDIPLDEGERLLFIERALKMLIKKYSPDVIGMERLFFSSNKKTAFSVAHARGVMLKTIAETRATLVELTPNQIKLAVAGNGNASKEAVAKMAGIILKTRTNDMIDDVTDALAVAIAAPFFIKKDTR
jgi:crossover junction endodeoxyribonuclease RuvC